MRNLKIVICLFLFFSFITATISSTIYESELHRFKVTKVTGGLNNPWGIDFLSANKLIVTEKNGAIKIISVTDGSQQLVRGGPTVSTCGQGGLMDVLLHPKHSDNNLVYFSLSKEIDNVCGTEVVKAKIENLEINDKQTIFVALPKNQDHRHFGSRLLFDQDGYLLISLGDRGHRPFGHDPSTHPGSIIPITHDGDIPNDNPFLGIDNIKPETLSYGHRNIQGLALDENNGIVWSVEHGPQGGCELNIIKPGKNYGWAQITYGRNYKTNAKIGTGTEREDVEPPVYYWTPSNAPSGLAHYDESAFPKWQGDLFVSSLTFELISRLEIKNSSVVNEERLLENEYGRIRHVQVGPDGHIYFLTDSEDGKVLRIQPL